MTHWSWLHSHLKIKEICSLSKLAHGLLGFWLKQYTLEDSGLCQPAVREVLLLKRQSLGWDLDTKRVQELSAYVHVITWRLLCVGNMRSEVLCRLEGCPSLDIGCAPLNACLQCGQGESWAIKDRRGCGGHMSDWAAWVTWTGSGWVYKQRVWCLGPAIFLFCPVPLSISSSNAYTPNNWWAGQLISGHSLPDTQFLPKKGSYLYN